MRMQMQIDQLALPAPGRLGGRRLGNRKETTGCVTCKKRRVKCDEAKPFCRRCTTTGRKCDGYTNTSALLVKLDRPDYSQAILDADHASPLSEIALVTRLTTSEEEQRAFRYFVHGGASALSGHIDLDLWSRLIPQTCHAEPAVRHAVVAIGSLLMQADAGVASPGSTPEPLVKSNTARSTFALQHYNRAIHSTLNPGKISHTDQLLRSITFLLFFCIETLQEQGDTAWDLFERARKAELMSFTHDENSPVSQELAAIFVRMAVQHGMLNGAIIPLGNSTETEITSLQPIHSLAQARAELNDLTILSQNLVMMGLKFRPLSVFLLGDDAVQNMTEDSMTELLSSVQTVDGALESWHTRLTAFRHSQPSISNQDAISIFTLLLHYRMTKIWLSGSTDSSEMVYDAYRVDYEDALFSARAALDLMRRVGSTRSFSFEMCLIPPLYIMTITCRHPVLRRQALALLRQAPAQEGLWNRDLVAHVCEKVIALEEATDGFRDYHPEELLVVLPPEEMRVKLPKINQRTTLEDGRRGNFVDFFTMPNGLDKAPYVIHDFVVV